jgi:hypothetical protein
VRITRPLTKTAYIVGGSVVLFGFGRLTVGLPELARTVLQLALFFPYLIVAVRSFRGRFEPVAPPRPWWRMTGRPKAGFWIAGFELVGAISTAFFPEGLEYWPVYVVDNGVIGLFYLNSSIQLVRRRITSVETTPRDLVVPRAHQVKP